MAIYQVVLLFSLVVAAPSDTGSLKIQSTPGTQVIWEGVYLDTTDATGVLTVTNIPPGRYNLVLQKSGFTPQKRIVEVAAGETVTLSVSLSPVSKPPQRLSPRRAETPPAPVPKEAKRQVEPPASRAAKNVPLWPALSNEPPAKTFSPSFGTLTLLILIPAALVIILYMVRRFRPAGLARPPLLSGAAPEEPAPRGGPKSAPFLRDLRRREELLEQGVEIIPPPPTGRVIDLDSTKVREVKE